MSIAVLAAATQTRLTTMDAVRLSLPTADQSLVDALIDAASAAIAQHTHRVWGRETVTETLPGTGTVYLGLSRTPLLSVGTVTEDSLVLTDYSIDDSDAGRLYRENGWAGGVVRGWGYEAYSSGYILPGHGAQRYAVSYTAGYVLPGGTVPVTLPADVQQAATETVKAWYQSRNRDPSLTRKTVDDVTYTYGTGGATPAPAALPPVAVALLRPWVRAPFAPGR